MDDRQQDFSELDFKQASELVGQRQRFQRRAKKASELINYLLARKGYAQTHSQDDVSESWQTVVGDKWKNKTSAGSIRRGVLEVVVESSAAHQQLKFMKRALLASLQKQMPQNKIKDIKFKVDKIG